ncbi:hypothetical protein A3D09_01150 [Candidatus Collierbacteria bacterium RIFCSPHIGHO2_02_FULL_49_10]|uniref:Uncharacterized protein n=2 Tax=Candidatus Collieribacteriota TaxID=1752725 RepID=A0A1F5EVE5_9BACT|nr:MAG: hypothetical protein A3D09_01150 [Candidatus Collierbacteria bacterium RIFCSPHIGHO2_02_FULL_49_10]OGD71433.1 MAG: hypothetical protein A2703_02930 [Candidatus Collierbacteria bacterium RIFCSPHIGHO2_01_FULL_50_25]
MPNDNAGSFPPPPTDNSQRSEDPEYSRGTTNPVSIQPEVKLTDEVAPDLSSPPTVEAEPQPAYRQQSAPIIQQPVYQPPATPMPASLPSSSGGHFPVVTFLLLLISIGAIAATYFFYQQTQNLDTQLSQITKTLEQQNIKENQATITPTPEITEEPTPTSTPSVGEPTITPSGSGPVFGNIVQVMALTKQQYPDSALILIKVTGAENPSLTLIKYWFRKTPNTKTYFYIQNESGKDPVMVDLSGRVSPDNNIPSLNSLVQSGKLGVDLPAALTIASSVCPTSFDCVNTPTTAQYIKITSTIWQITYSPSDGSKPFVVQIDSVSSKINFKSM